MVPAGGHLKKGYGWLWKAINLLVNKKVMHVEAS